MAESLGTIYYDVDANLEPLLGKMRQAEAALGGLGKGMGKVDGSARQMQQEFDKTERSAASLSGQLNGLTRVIKGVVAAMAIREMAGMVQQYQAMAERVQMATRSADEFEMVQRRLQSTADGTYRSLSEAQELFIRTADSIRDMGYSLEQVIDIQDSMSYAFVTNATSADRAQAAINQFTKAVNTGKVSADQWETITSAIPSVVNDIATATGRAASEVRALGASGKLAARDLTEGLRKSLDENRKAADNMATDLVDAGVRVRNAMTTVLVALEEQTGGIQKVTDGIIAAAEAMLEFGQDAEKMEAFLNLATTAAASLAAVVAGRLLTSLGASTAALYQNTIAARAKAAAELQAAQTAAALAAQNLIQAQAAERAARGLAHHATMAANLTAAQTAATAATTRLATAQSAMAGAFSVATMAANGLRTALAFLGGPAGLILLVGAAFLTMGRNAKMASSDIQELISSVETLGTRTLEFRRIELEKSLAQQEKAAARAAKIFEQVSAEVYYGARGQEIMASRTAKAGKDLEEATAKAQEYRDALASINRELERRASGADVGPQLPPGWTPPNQTGGTGGTGTELSEFQKLEQSLKNQIELAKRTGLARAELAALQRLGADATDEERARITELVGELHQLEEATKAAEKAEAERLKSSEEARRAAEDNAAVLAGLREQLYQTTLNAEELAMRQAELALNSYATPDQVAEVRALAAELYAAQQAAAELERRRSAFGTDVAGAIRGQVSPLSGGAFDDQQARYEAEAQAEQQRYAEAMERLREAKELELEVKGGYMALEQQMAQEHADRMAQIEQARIDMMVSQSASAFGQMASDLEAFAKTFGAENSKMMAIAKTAAIAQTIMETYAGAQKAFSALAGIPIVGPALGTAAAAAAIAGGMARVAQIRGTPGRLAGGPVTAGKMYRVNENGAPEVFSAANGQQFMIPNQRGEVVSNRDAAGSGGVVINIHNAPPGTTAEQSTGQDGVDVIDVWIADFMADGRTAGAVQGKFGLSPQGR